MVSGDRHGSQRIIKVRSAATADLVAVSVDREHPAELGVVAAESKLQRVRKRMCNRFPDRSFFGFHDSLRTSITTLISSVGKLGATVSLPLLLVIEITRQT